MIALLLLLVSVLSVSANLFNKPEHNTTALHQDIFSHVSHMFPTIRNDLLKHVSNQYKMIPIKATEALVSQRKYPSFSWMNVKHAIRVNQLSYCTSYQLKEYQCNDCEEFIIKSIRPSDYSQSIIYSTPSYIMVSFKETVPSVLTWMTTLNTQQTSYPCPGCRVNMGFYTRYTEIVEETVTILTELYETNQLPIYVSGHSVGAAIATLFAMHVRLKHPFLPLTHVFTFGSPRVGNDKFVKMAYHLFGTNWFRFMNQFDVIPSVPPLSFGYRHTGHLVTCNTGTSICNIDGREDNTGGIQADLTRIIESNKNVQLCHFTYLTEHMKCE